MSSLTSFVKNGKKIVGVAANYKTAPTFKEVPSEPLIFIKPTSSYIVEGETVIIPEGFCVNQEVELGVVIGKRCKSVCESEAMLFVGGYCVAQDMTATNLMVQARKQGMSWTLGKGFDTACPVSKFIPKEMIPNPHQVELWCSVNDKERQRGNTKDLIFDIPRLISFISQYITLEANDVILTGSPPNMGPVKVGDCIKSGITGLDADFSVIVCK